MKKLVFYPERCTGCAICTVACVTKHTDGNLLDFKTSRIRVRVDKQKILQVTNVCVQCEEAYCVSACPVGALSKDNVLGYIKVDKDLCISCGSCVEACPYKGIILSHVDVKPIICDLCYGDPQCVKWCPFNALEYLDINEKTISLVKLAREKMISLIKEIR